jgi:hypothetical protein
MMMIENDLIPYHTEKPGLDDSVLDDDSAILDDDDDVLDVS